ncbi:glycine betaine ABC transporter substrate-binding protein [Streptomyces sp. NPDC051985]|uniref:glycine betaine ABC transporter substrate-binding protein n=1 Tax=Streptomyces sp. NPDC051985 TaxID=3155807 RepID=UPI003417FE77
MAKRHRAVAMRAGIAVSVLALTVAGCSSGKSGGSGGGKTLTIGVIPGWTDETSTAYLLQNVLEAKGYTVDITKLSDAAPLYTALANGDIDLVTSAWTERTHKAYVAKYPGKFEDLDTYYAEAKLFLGVPTYSKMTSITDLPGNASALDGKIIGIEPGAGLTATAQDKVMPAYGLNSKFKLVTSSTTAMLTELKKATAAKKDIVVTLWKPFWANQAFPVRPLEDPKGAFGASEGLHELAHTGFSKSHPEVANLLKHFKLSDAQYGSLENTVVNKYGEGKEPQAVAAWLKANPDFAPALEKYLTK